MTDAPRSIQENRPLSPHLSIYRPQISSVLSILHRITGVALYIGMLLLTLWIIASVHAAPDLLEPVQAFIKSIFGLLLLGGWSFCLFYHLLNGIRHLYWDIGKGFELDTMYKTGVAVVIGSIALTALCWAVVFKVI